MFQRRTTHPGVRGDKVKRIMSKNFIELIQLDHEPAIPPEVSLRSNNGDGPAHGNGARLDLACLAREEFLKLVQRVFLSRPHVRCGRPREWMQSDMHRNRRYTRAQCLGLGVPDRC
jgi:hypothetical protein